MRIRTGNGSVWQKRHKTLLLDRQLGFWRKSNTDGSTSGKQMTNSQPRVLRNEVESNRGRTNEWQEKPTTTAHRHAGRLTERRRAMDKDRTAERTARSVYTNTRNVYTNTRKVYRNTRSVYRNTRSVYTHTRNVYTNTRGVYRNTRSVYTAQQTLLEE